MVVAIKLEEDQLPTLRRLDARDERKLSDSALASDAEVFGDNPNREKAITKAMGCYPVIREVISYIDLNSLDALSSTCRQVRVNLLQYRKQLIKSTLRCENEVVISCIEHRYHNYLIERENNSRNQGVGRCARDFVDHCRRCDRVVCRNCVIKPPSSALLRCRHRRMCLMCSQIDLSSLVNSRSASFGPTLSYIWHPTVNQSGNFSKTYFCSCVSDRIWLCKACGRSVCSADQDYERIWKWCTRYLPSLGAINNSIGDGGCGVPCGLGENCAKAREVEMEIDCDAEDARENNLDYISGRNTSRRCSGGSSQVGPGYKRHEIEGIGGVMKKKLVKIVRVGASVSEWRDDSVVDNFLAKERDGSARSWCAWCRKIIPSIADRNLQLSTQD
ncbi:BgTH12-06303 [Blumeria graminis f. sp. triticale]|uniref:BgTH12-06303 n=1 Tax=Blumeria graminis f. sp. triticale TaxID=1689686 RepID=A0A9W4CXX0_BLUGR|nr:BgTH12-06303 [Blumeria graminis f. sp. triticale]